MFTAVLQMNVTEDGSWDFLPQDLWLTILDSFVLPSCSSVGFDRAQGGEDLSRIECFSDWQPRYVGRGRVHITWLNAYSQQVDKEDAFGLFEYTEELHDRLRSVKNTYWKVYDESYPADELYFFQEERVLMIAAPYEGSIMFCELSEQQKEQLLGLDARIPPNLHPLTDRLIFSEVVEDDPAEDSKN